jgi:ferrochelatase
MGGPSTPAQVEPFLRRLFADGELIDFGRWQKPLANFIVRRRLKRITEQYTKIGGSPIRKWTDYQGAEMVKVLDVLSPQTAPHKAYTMFRYADPLAAETLLEMKKDGVERAVAFSQYPQFSCTTSGSSFNDLWRQQAKLGVNFQWSVLDRWPTYPTFIKAVAKCVQKGLEGIPEHLRDQTVLQFSAHSLPTRVVNKGDQYVSEVAATTMAVMQELKMSHRYILCWQSQVGPLPWQGPQTGEALTAMGKKGIKSVLVIPIAFTSDHIETLYEVDVDYREAAHKAGLEHFARAPALNGEPLFIQAQAELVASHLKHGRSTETLQYSMRCPSCTNPLCRSVDPVMFDPSES